MKIEEIIELLKSRCEPDAEGSCGDCDIAEATATLERLKPVTVTEDPETWPEDSRKKSILLVRVGKHGRKVNTTMKAHFLFRQLELGDVREKNISMYIGCAWQYLPKWGSE